MSKISHIDTKEGLLEILKDGSPILVDFFAEWCGPCKMLAPVLEQVAEEFDGKAKIVKIDIDKAENLAYEYQVSAVPTLVYFKDGKVVTQARGLQSKTQIVKQLETL